MKKALRLLLALTIFIGLGSCTSRAASETKSQDQTKYTPRMEAINNDYTHGIGFCVLRDNRTGVCYLCANNGITVMYSPDGTILVDKGKE